jgi:predicted nucleic acid-binding protein
MSIVTVREVWYIIAREVSEQEADASIRILRDLRIQFEDADWSVSLEAARFKSRDRMSYADCFAAALANCKKADLVTGDGELKPLDGEIKISWI